MSVTYDYTGARVLGNSRAPMPLLARAERRLHPVAGH